MKLEQEDFEILIPIIKESIIETLTELKHNEFEKKIHNKTQIAEIIGKSYNFVTELIKDGFLKTTSDNKHCSGKQINEYLKEASNE